MQASVNVMEAKCGLIVKSEVWSGCFTAAQMKGLQSFTHAVKRLWRISIVSFLSSNLYNRASEMDRQ